MFIYVIINTNLWTLHLRTTLTSKSGTTVRRGVSLNLNRQAEKLNKISHCVFNKVNFNVTKKYIDFKNHYFLNTTSLTASHELLSSYLIPLEELPLLCDLLRGRRGKKSLALLLMRSYKV